MKPKRKKKPDYKKIERELLGLERRLKLELQERLGNVQNLARQDPTELLDIAAEGEIDYMSAVSAEAGSITIDEIQQALRKLREGTYGVCEACRKSIRKRRLKARPFAVLCITCKESQERLGYVEEPGTLSTRSDSGVTVSLTDEDVHGAESNVDDVFRDVQDIEVNGLF